MANCVAMQNLLLKKVEESPENITLAHAATVPADFERPNFTLNRKLNAGVLCTDFRLTEADINPTDQSTAAQISVKKCFRVAIVKALVPSESCGPVLEKAIKHFSIANTATQVFVVCEDMASFPGCISMQSGSDQRGIAGHRALESIVHALGHSKFMRYMIVM